MRNLQEQVKKAFCYQKLFWPFTTWINCSSDLKNFALPSASNFKSFSRSEEQFFLTVGQNNFGNKIPFLYFQIVPKQGPIKPNYCLKLHPLYKEDSGITEISKQWSYYNCYLFYIQSFESQIEANEFCRTAFGEKYIGKFFIMSMEFDKNISDWRYDCTVQKNGFDFFMRLVKWPKIAVKKCQNLIFKVNFQRQKSPESF